MDNRELNTQITPVKPEQETSALFLLLGVAAIGGIVYWYSNRKSSKPRKRVVKKLKRKKR